MMYLYKMLIVHIVCSMLNYKCVYLCISYILEYMLSSPRLAKQQALTHGDEVVMDELCRSSRHLCFVWLSSGVSQVEIKFGVPQIVAAKHVLHVASGNQTCLAGENPAKTWRFSLLGKSSNQQQWASFQNIFQLATFHNFGG